MAKVATRMGCGASVWALQVVYSSASLWYSTAYTSILKVLFNVYEREKLVSSEYQVGKHILTERAS